MKYMRSSLSEDELLSEEVKKYPSLYDKREKDYKDKIVNINSWKNVSEALEIGSDGMLNMIFDYFVVS